MLILCSVDDEPAFVLAALFVERLCNAVCSTETMLRTFYELSAFAR